MYLIVEHPDANVWLESRGFRSKTIAVFFSISSASPMVLSFLGGGIASMRRQKLMMI